MMLLFFDKIERRTELDRGQSEALLAALLREFCHIQGPPGTGKSFLGVRIVKILLDCRAANLGPIIIVCYTNHALDQFLEHLIQSGVEKVIRVGGQSKSDMLAGKNLRVVSRRESTTRSESGTVGATYAALKREIQSMEEILRQLDGLNDYPSWKSVKDYLALQHPRIYRQFSRFDEDGYETVGGEPFDLWLKHNTQLPRQQSQYQEASTIDDLLEMASINVHALHGDEKLRIAKFLAEAVRKDLTDELYESNKAIEAFHHTIQNVYSDIDRRVLQTADIIGVTTTGLATKISTLRHVNAKVIICEEAGEVLEAHMLSALLPSVEHVVSIANLKGFPFIKKIYPRLVDHSITKVLPDVVGMRENTFWLDHDNFQDNVKGDGINKKSHSNTWEVEMTAALVRHIVRQGVYSSSDIAVLTPYSGQLQKLRLHMRKEFEIVLSDRDEEVLAKDGFIASDEELDNPNSNQIGDRKPLQKKNLSELLRIATVDNFQGEEAKVVIVSLVRSNQEKNVGFLKTTNRINVLLSRAQHGLYLIGNSKTYASVGMWKHVLGKDCGLCLSRCEVQCGHSQCTLKCHEACAPCIEKCKWACEHQGGCNMPCAAPCDRLPCNERCSFRLSCDHQCPGICGEPCPEDYCQTCSAKQDQRVDLLELKSYKEIDLDETPIIALSCGHFFTAESLDGMFEMSEVYKQDVHGGFIGINESHSFASSIPQCPDCKCPLQQYATPRYNRVINRAVIDEMSKRFLVSGQVELQRLENRARELEQEYENSAIDSILEVGVQWGEMEATRLLKEREDKSRGLERAVKNFCEKVKDKYQPATKLHDAVITAYRQRSLEYELQALSIREPARTSPRDRRIVFAGAGVMLKVQYVTLADKFSIAQKLRSNGSPIEIPEGLPDALGKSFLQSCSSHIDLCLGENLPKLAVQGILYYAKITKLYNSYVHSSSSSKSVAKRPQYEVERAKELLEQAKRLCEKGFQNADLLLTAVEESIKFLDRECGHWYECERGHPFAIGECGMPMEEASCPECGARIGGQSHNLIEGVVRSERMER
ncbi:hypothetical protein DID88_003810 [Monilinia fructigena]|uniref:RZ-type domain-containing protein n=1 Tax=Monilinia fructigena TaxID=38457 RepID=A0A395ITL8_9HELO|nr:hypothetical protein DID88_003810 [Monilinia fructigena]